MQLFLPCVKDGMSPSESVYTTYIFMREFKAQNIKSHFWILSSPVITVLGQYQTSLVQVGEQRPCRSVSSLLTPDEKEKLSQEKNAQKSVGFSRWLKY